MLCLGYRSNVRMRGGEGCCGVGDMLGLADVW